jgi:uncharacterized BrkB/YihY/UPF0761 family membrane protein
MLSLFRYGLHWPAAVQAIYLALRDFFPGELGNFIQSNLRATVESRGPFQLTSILLLLITANGVFEPLEVALNRVWGAASNRTYLKNQLISLALIFMCGGLAFLSFVLTVLNREAMTNLFGTGPHVPLWMGLLFFKIAAVPVSILGLFFIYWLLPNRPIAPRRVVPVAILIGLALEVLKYINLITWPLLKAKLIKEYGPFYISVSIVLWSFVAAMLVLSGAEWAARRDAEKSL